MPGLLQGVYAFFGVTAFWRSRLGEKHPLTLTAPNNVAVVLRLVGEFQLASEAIEVDVFAHLESAEAALGCGATIRPLARRWARRPAVDPDTATDPARSGQVCSPKGPHGVNFLLPRATWD